MKERILEIKAEIVDRNRDQFEANRNFSADLEEEEKIFIAECMFSMYTKVKAVPFKADTLKDIKVEVNSVGHSLKSFDPAMTHFVAYYDCGLSGNSFMSYDLSYNKLAGPTDLSAAGITKAKESEHGRRVREILRQEIKWHPYYPDMKTEPCRDCNKPSQTIHHHLYSFSELLSDYEDYIKNKGDIKFPEEDDIIIAKGEPPRLSEEASPEAKKYIKNFIRAHYGYVDRDEMELIPLCNDCHKRYPKDFPLDQPIILKPQELPDEEIEFDLVDMLN